MKRLKHNAARTAARWDERERLRESRESHYVIQDEETGLYWAGHAAPPPSRGRIVKLAGEEIRALRLQLKEEQHAFGRRFLVTRRTVIRWEQGGHDFGVRWHGAHHWDEEAALSHATAQAAMRRLCDRHRVFFSVSWWDHGGTWWGHRTRYHETRDEREAHDLAAELLALLPPQGAASVRVRLGMD